MKKKRKFISKLLIFLAFCFLMIMTIYNLYIMYENIDINDNSQYIAQKTGFSTDYRETVENVIKKDQTVSDMLENIVGSVVGISKLTSAGGSILNNVSSDELGLGTGIIVSSNGYILSNSHVTGERFSSCYVTIDETTYKGKVVWSEEDLDLSIVKIKASNLKYSTLGDSKNIRIGDSVFAIGNPIGYEFKRTVTSGIISAIDRTIKVDENDQTTYISNLIQTDATINPGNSGGPLVNGKGEVIGINTVKVTSAEGIGFAIPINVIKPVIDSFKEKGEFEQATLGIYGYDGKVAEYLKLKNKITHGVYVSMIVAQSAAANSNLKEGDLITSIDGISINTLNDLREYIYTKSPMDIVTLNIIRKEKQQDVQVTLGKKEF